MFGVPNSDGFMGIQPDDVLNMPPHHITRWSESVFWHIAQQFGLEVIAVEAESLSFSPPYADTRLMRLMMRKLKMKQTFLFYGWRYVMLKKAAKMLRQIMMAGLYDAHLLPKGPAILAVLRKIPSQ